MTNGEKPASRSITPEPVGLPMPPEGMPLETWLLTQPQETKLLYFQRLGNVFAQDQAKEAERLRKEAEEAQRKEDERLAILRERIDSLIADPESRGMIREALKRFDAANPRRPVPPRPTPPTPQPTPAVDTTPAQGQIEQIAALSAQMASFIPMMKALQASGGASGSGEASGSGTGKGKKRSRAPVEEEEEDEVEVTGTGFTSPAKRRSMRGVKRGDVFELPETQPAWMTADTWQRAVDAEALLIREDSIQLMGDAMCNCCTGKTKPGKQTTPLGKQMDVRYNVCVVVPDQPGHCVRCIWRWRDGECCFTQKPFSSGNAKSVKEKKPTNLDLARAAAASTAPAEPPVSPDSTSSNTAANAPNPWAGWGFPPGPYGYNPYGFGAGNFGRPPGPGAG
ncbi:hypothetical protein HD553DRAFT_346620 [Filobasidium floriforme]|uniref:uncharacterized protein n=1 Tax=Filobasidium floriforme TaxID=5210 RepID=UPI001E8CF55B|nr:uncharacterized protein HD553DRAFT_346620 [Filobasidium floriforme]KAH8077446.1 hypothetical protein HD553DRAFT_346620 [Filobasidium floriforme]